jgi:ornithine decarboxylase
MLDRFSTTEAMIEARRPEESILCIRPEVLRTAAQAFVAAFDGQVLYAVKANPLRPVVDAIHAGGVRHFDTASLREIAAISQWYPDAHTYFMHPVKGWDAMRVAYHRFGVRHFVVDHPDELAKILDVLKGVEEPPVLMVRLSTPETQATFQLSDKFGAPPEQAAQLLRSAVTRGARTGLCFHVGSQCVTPEAYADALRVTDAVLRGAGVEIECLDVGGGFPAAYEGVSPPPLADFLEVVRDGVAALDLPANCVLMCEPGRALAAAGMSVVTRVLLRKGSAVYLNDGIYGTLGGTAPELRYPARVIRPAGCAASERTAFTVFGPTCSSADVLPCPLELPADVETGDWIEFGMLGAYGAAFRTDFNGFEPTAQCSIDAPFSA